MKHFDMEQFRRHCAATVKLGDRAVGEQADADTLLQYWYENKNEYLYRMMGEELILSKPIKYVRSADELSNTMFRTLRVFNDFECRFWDELKRHMELIDPLWDYYFNTGITEEGKEANRFWTSLSNSMEYFNLADGARINIRVRSGAPATTVSAVIKGEKIVLTQGQKVMKVLGKLCEMFGMTEEFEAYRIAHSQALNQKTISGMLHLSIHPLDYATASDNNNGWDSCMSWYNKGCYRLGTIEMMNSPCVVCAYLTGNNIMEDVGGGEWNSKKWRAWVIVDKDIIALNRQYPYYNEDLAKEVLDWVAELASTNLGWEYNPFVPDYEYSDNDFYFHCGYMYNDFDGSCPARVREGARGKEIYFSGPANCMWCGEEITGEIDQGTTTCQHCSNLTYCACCEEFIRDDDILWGPDGNPYCYDCYNSNFTECENCNEIRDSDNIITIDLAYSDSCWENLVRHAPEGSYLRRHFQYGLGITNPERHVTLCRDCLRELGIDPAEDLLHDVEIPFNYYRHFWSSHYSTGIILDPRRVSFEQAYRLFGIHGDAHTRDAMEALWDNYTENLYAHGTISRE